MNFNIWNIKEMLSTPTATGSNKFSIRSSAPSDYSSLSDSQLLFGSQFCPENVQLAAAPLELGTQLGQHNSQDSEPSIFTKYQTKPQLFDEDTREKGSRNFGAGRVKSVLENFEANKNKIKDKYDREVLGTFMSSVKDKLQELQARLDKFGEMFDSRNKFILVHLETTSKALQDALQSHCDSVLKALTDKSQMEQALLEMERRLAAKDVEISDVKSGIQLLKEGLESLPAQLSDQHLKLCEERGFLKLPEALAELHTVISSTRLPPRTADNSSQTSPGPCQGCAPGEESVCWLCCRGRGVCSSSWWSQSLCMAAGEQDGASPLRSHPCVCCADSHFLGVSQKKHCPVLQDVPLSTPLRKAVRRSAWGFEPVTPSKQRQLQVCRLSVRKDVPGRRDGNWATNSEVENAAGGNKAKQRLGSPPWVKAKGRKKTCPAVRKGELSLCADGGLKQKKAKGITELESSRKSCFPRCRVALNLGSSNLISAAPDQQILRTAQPRLAKNFPPVPCSNKSLQHLADKRKRSLEMKKRTNVSTVRRNFWDSSPQENVFSLCSSAGEKELSCFSLRSPAAPQKPRPVTALSQQDAAHCSLVFDSDYSD